MRKVTWLSIVGALTTAGVMAGPAAAELTNSYVRDGVRICVYDDVRGAYTNPIARSLTIDRNDDCPRSPRPTVVPALAILDGSYIADGKRICRYAYAGRLYMTAIDVGMSCTYTPR